MAAPVVMTSHMRSADAQVVVRVGGHVHARMRLPHFRFSWHRWYRPVRYRRHVRIFWGAPVYVPRTYYVGPFAEPPPPPPPPPIDDCDCGNAPAVPIQPHYRVQPPAATVARRRPADHKRLAIGAFGGHTQVENGAEGDDVGLLAQFRLSHSLTLEGEVGKTSLADNTRVDKRAGVALLFNFRNLFSRSRLTPYVLAGMGVSHVDVDGGDWSNGQGYGELGAGLSLRLTRSISLALDVRAGVRALTDQQDQPMALRSSTNPLPPPDAAPANDENYSRVRLAAMLHF